jgi:hypothetical protein
MVPLVFPFLVIILLGCAAQAPPGGGPEDKTGPLVISTFPEYGATQVKPSVVIEFIFSEPLDTRLQSKSLMITPQLSKTPLLTVNRRRMVVQFQEPLTLETTYVLNFGRNVKDLRGNPTATEIRLAFATGDSLDQASISGRVYDLPEKQNAFVWAYRRQLAFSDSIWCLPPDYITTVGSDGRYLLTNLARGCYRLLAVAGSGAEQGSLRDGDWLGLPEQDSLVIRHIDSHLGKFNFRLLPAQFKPFRLGSYQLDRNIMRLNFSLPLAEEQLNFMQLNIEPSIQARPIPFLSPDQPNQMQIYLQGLQDSTQYSLTLQSIINQNEDTLKILQPVEFFSAVIEDTTPPSLIDITPKQGARDVLPSKPLHLEFSEPVQWLHPDSALHWRSVHGEVAYDSEWVDGNTLLLKSNLPLESHQTYTMEVVGKFWQDYAGNVCIDSLRSSRFTTLDTEQFGSISGRVLASDSLVSGIIIISARNALKQTVQLVACDAQGNFTLDQLPPGQYTLALFWDRNFNGRFDPGRLIPFHEAEFFSIYPQPVEVRARWETAEIEVHF